MNFTRAFSLSAFAIAGLTGSLNASAEQRLYYHWDSFGSSGEPGGVTYVQVIDGWYDDGTGGPSADRFPNSGKRGKGMMNKDGKVDNPTTPGKGCTFSVNVEGTRGLPAGIRIWPYYIDPSTPTVLQVAFRANFDLINQDQQKRGSTFRYQETDINSAHLFISPGGIAPKLRDGEVATTHIHGNRDGSIRSTWTVVVNAPITAELAETVAAHEIGHTTGIDDNRGVSNSPDANYPTAMFYASGEIPGQKMDACTLAAIDANVNGGKD